MADAKVIPLDDDTRARLRVIVAGEPMLDLAPLRRRIAGAGLSGTIDLVARRLVPFVVLDPEPRLVNNRGIVEADQHDVRSRCAQRAGGMAQCFLDCGFHQTW